MHQCTGQSKALLVSQGQLRRIHRDVVFQLEFLQRPRDSLFFAAVLQAIDIGEKGQILLHAQSAIEENFCDT